MLRALIMQLQDIVGKVMVGQHAGDPAVIDRHVVAVPDNLCPLTQRKRMGDRESDDLLLDVGGSQRFDRRLAPRMRQGALVQQPQEALTLKASQIPPETPIIDPCVLALLTQGAFLCEDGTQRFIAGQRCLIRCGATDEEVELWCPGRGERHRFLL